MVRTKHFFHKKYQSFTSKVRGCSQTTSTRRGRYIGGPKMSTFCQRSYHRKCQRRGVVVKKSQNLVKVDGERPLTASNYDLIYLSKTTSKSRNPSLFFLCKDGPKPPTYPCKE